MQAVDEIVQHNVNCWLQGAFDEKTKDEIKRLQREDPEQLADCFYKQLSFGTGGMRGLMGVGTNRMNEYTVSMVTQALANTIFLLNQDPNKGVVVGYDSRNHSKLFAQTVANVLNANNIRVFLFNTLSPVALISFAVREKEALFGVMITASHNPPRYNGYKVYGPDGGQVLEPYDQYIVNEVAKVVDFSQVKKGQSNDYVINLATEVRDNYLKTIAPLALHPGNTKTYGKELKIIYTPLHGAGITLLPLAMRDWGFKNFSIVEAQAILDGNFPTVKVPNPEEPEALKLGIEQMEKEGGDFLIATDPDSDRLGVVVLHKGKSMILNGNEIGVLAMEHLCHSLQTTHRLPPKPTLIKTIVTTELLAEIARHYGMSTIDLLTGFKYIGQKITQFEKEAKITGIQHHFIFGAEESYGYLYGTHVRDKDAIIASLLIAEYALQLKMQNKTLIDALLEIYQKYGVYREALFTFTLEGRAGQERMKELFKKLREAPFKEVDKVKVTLMEDYLTHQAIDFVTHMRHSIALPKSDVLRFWLEDGTKIVLRGSGTEPKLKLYCAVVDKKKHQTLDEVEKSCKILDHKLIHLGHSIKQLLKI